MKKVAVAGIAVFAIGSLLFYIFDTVLPPVSLRALRRVSPGMTQQQVEQLLGKPRGVYVDQQEWHYFKDGNWSVVRIYFDKDWRVTRWHYDY